MLSATKLKQLCRQRRIGTDKLAEHLVKAGMDGRQAITTVKNWQKGLFNPQPRSDDVKSLAGVLSVDVNDLMDWRSACRYAPMSPRKARLVTQLIVGRSVQDAMDILKFTRKRAAETVNKVLKAAVADADEQQADVENLYVSEARVDDAGIRIGTKRWIEKDRGRAHSLSKKACHIYVTVTEGGSRIAPRRG